MSYITRVTIKYESCWKNGTSFIQNFGFRVIVFSDHTYSHSAILSEYHAGLGLGLKYFKLYIWSGNYYAEPNLTNFLYHFKLHTISNLDVYILLNPWYNRVKLRKRNIIKLRHEAEYCVPDRLLCGSKKGLVSTPTYAGISIDSKPCWENLFFQVLPMPGDGPKLGCNFRV